VLVDDIYTTANFNVFVDSPIQLENRVANAPLLRYVDSVRTHGHRAARIDPLDLLQRDNVAALDPERYGLTDPTQKYNVDGILWSRAVGEPAPREGDWWTLADIVAHLRAVYIGNIAYEYMHSHSKTERLWFSHILEAPHPNAAQEEALKLRERLHKLLVESETFDQFLQAKFPNLKRYGLEGGESMIPALDALFSVAAKGNLSIHFTTRRN
jgi:probable 2-oxoglutarate dehydrogenase E1 component DHKTD1